MSAPPSPGNPGPPRKPGKAEQQSLDELFRRHYPSLRELARYQLRRERPDHTLSSSSLIHEVYLKLLELRQQQWRDEAHFMAVASGVMRRVLVDSARRKRALKRQAGSEPVPAEQAEELLTDAQAERLLLLEETLERLSQEDEMAGRLVELRYFGGLSVEECAGALELSYATARRRWEFAKAWLRRHQAEQP